MRYLSPTYLLLYFALRNIVDAQLINPPMINYSAPICSGLFPEISNKFVARLKAPPNPILLPKCLQSIPAQCSVIARVTRVRSTICCSSSLHKKSVTGTRNENQLLHHCSPPRKCGLTLIVELQSSCRFGGQCSFSSTYYIPILRCLENNESLLLPRSCFPSTYTESVSKLFMASQLIVLIFLVFGPITSSL